MRQRKHFESGPLGNRVLTFWNRLCAVRLRLSAVLWIIAALASIRILFIGVLPWEYTLLAPDESAFAELVSLMSTGGEWERWRGGTGARWFVEMLTFLGPAVMLEGLGLNPFLSMRLVSSAYLSATQLLFVLTAFRLQSLESGRAGIPFVSLRSLGVFALLLTPSLNLWGALGLRESATLFWSSAFIVSLLAILRVRKLSVALLAPVSLCIISVCAQMVTRPYLAFIMLAALVPFAVVGVTQRRALAVVVITSSAAAGVVVGLNVGSITGVDSRFGPEIYVGNAWLDCGSEERFASISGSGYEECGIEVPNVSSRSIIIRKCGKKSKDQCPPGGVNTNSKPPENPDAARRTGEPSQLRYLNQWKRLHDIRMGGVRTARSVIDPGACDEANTFAQAVVCEVGRLPYATFSVLLRPTIFDGESRDSQSTVFASLENFWWAFMMVFGLIAIARPSLFAAVKAYSISVILMYVLFMSVAQGNLGTSFRHKSQLIIFIATLLIVAQQSDVKAVRTRDSAEPSDE